MFGLFSAALKSWNRSYWNVFDSRYFVCVYHHAMIKMYPRVLWYHWKLFLNGKRFLFATTWMGLAQQFSQNHGLFIFAMKHNSSFYFWVTCLNSLRFNSASVNVTTRAFLLKHYSRVRKSRTYITQQCTMSTS